MIAFARPPFLLAGALLALVPLALHLLARRPPEQRPLPTTRFLRPLPRTALRLERRPSDLLLLLLRSLLLLLLGTAFAGPTWSPKRAGAVDVVLLDRGAGMRAGWAEGVDSARAALAGGGELILFDTVAARTDAGALTAAHFDSLAAAGPGTAPADYAAAFRALGTVARGRPDADSFRVTLITRPRWEGWSAGFGEMRRAVWPGAVRLVEVGDGSESEPAPTPRREGAGQWAVRVLGGEGHYVRAALAASAGWGEVDVVLLPGGAAGAELLARARGGAVVVVAGEVPPGVLGDALPWSDGERSADVGAPGALVLPSGEAILGATARHPGVVRDGARLLAVWEDGRAAAAAISEGEGCLVYLATALERGRLPLDPTYPALVEHLAHGCDAGSAPGTHGGAPTKASTDHAPGAFDVRPLDQGARALLRGAGEWMVPATALSEGGEATGRPLGRWLLLGALVAALVETAFAYRRRAA